MRIANSIEEATFKAMYCQSEKDRNNIINDYGVEVESYEELLPGKAIKSYATGNREIRREFIMFRVEDKKNNIVYYPVFGATVGRTLAREAGLALPKMMSIFVDGGGSAGGEGGGGGAKRRQDNRQMLLLIRFARSMMILHKDDIKPMYGPFKRIYDKLEAHPNYDVYPSDIRRINTAISHFLATPENKNNENFGNLQDYIEFLLAEYPERRLKRFNFNILRGLFLSKYPNEGIFF